MIPEPAKPELSLDALEFEVHVLKQKMETLEIIVESLQKTQDTRLDMLIKIVSGLQERVGRLLDREIARLNQQIEDGEYKPDPKYPRLGGLEFG